MKISQRIHLVASIGALLATACGGQQKSDSGMPSTPAPSVAPSASMEPAVSASSAPAPTAAPAVPTAEPAAQVTSISIPIEPRSGSKLKGTARFEPTADGVKVTVDVTDAPPGKHGAHIHQNADCSAKDGKSAGDHFNPGAHNHGLPSVEARHLGDLGNLEVGKDGKGHLDITIAGATLKSGDKFSFVDRGIIIHEKIDDGSQPAGNAGKRIGCGEIKR
jgi:Cu-Zn family superoxide dismutase